VVAVLADSVDPAMAVTTVRQLTPGDPEKAQAALFKQVKRHPESVLDERRARTGKRSLPPVRQ
jgi:hypothetical protein